MKQLVEYVAKNLVDDPDAVSVETIGDEKMTRLRLKAAQSDLGRVIGNWEGGGNARAMRTLLHAAAAKSGRRAPSEILQ